MMYSHQHFHYNPHLDLSAKVSSIPWHDEPQHVGKARCTHFWGKQYTFPPPSGRRSNSKPPLFFNFGNCDCSSSYISKFPASISKAIFFSPNPAICSIIRSSEPGVVFWSFRERQTKVCDHVGIFLLFVFLLALSRFPSRLVPPATPLLRFQKRICLGPIKIKFKISYFGSLINTFHQLICAVYYTLMP